MGLKSFCPCCYKLVGNMETIATHMREVHYWLAIAYNVCQYVSAGWLGPSIRVQAQVAQEEIQGKRSEKSFLKLVPMSPAGQKDAQDLPSYPKDEHGLI